MSKLVTHKIDPVPDTVIKLKNPLIKFAPWEESKKKPALPSFPSFGFTTPATNSGLFGAAPTQTTGASPFGIPAKSTSASTSPWGTRPTTGGSSWGASTATTGASPFGAVASNTSTTPPGADNDKEKPKVQATSLFGGDVVSPESKAGPSNAKTPNTEPVNSDATPGDFGPEEEEEDNEYEENEEEQEEEDSIHYEVSSRHLILASSRFRTMLSGEKWQEGIRGKDDLFTITTEDWDGNAFCILMNVLHLRNRSVPRTIDLDMLAKIAIMVDYYECHEAVEIMTNIWIDHVISVTPVPKTYGRDLLLWLCIAWIFRKHDTFRAATLITLQHSDEQIRDLGLPIPQSIIDILNTRRQQAIGSLVTRLHTGQATYRSKLYNCPEKSENSFECGSMMFGALAKGMDDLGLPLFGLWGTTYDGLTFTGLSEKIKSLESPKWFSSPPSEEKVPTPPVNSSGGLFGASRTTSPSHVPTSSAGFGASMTSTSSGGFGASMTSTSSGGFGASTTSTSSMGFGQPRTANTSSAPTYSVGFGSGALVATTASTSSGSLFGSPRVNTPATTKTSSPSLFGQAKPPVLRHTCSLQGLIDSAIAEASKHISALEMTQFLSDAEAGVPTRDKEASQNS